MFMAGRGVCVVNSLVADAAARRRMVARAGTVNCGRTTIRSATAPLKIAMAQ